jgi:dTDP-glucose 4,6-dehydratase
MRTWLVTGGAGFIGSNLVIMARRQKWARIVNLDKLTYAGHLENLAELQDDPDHIFVHGDIADSALVDKLLTEYQPQAMINLAAESHVDRSILGPQAFIKTNVVGTLALLVSALQYWQGLKPPAQKKFRFLQVSTDEVYGSLEAYVPGFTESHPYQPNSPYAASKAAADHLVRAYQHTYGLPTLTTNCSNNYGPYQYPEKLIPLVILNARGRKPLPVYGDGKHVRDWLYVEDHCTALRSVLENGRPGETYNIGGNCERTNLEIVTVICRMMDGLFPSPMSHIRLVSHVVDRPGHDRRYGIDISKIQHALGWQPSTNFEQGLAQTVTWYLSHPEWITAVCSEQHQQWMDLNYDRRGAS